MPTDSVQSELRTEDRVFRGSKSEWWEESEKTSKDSGSRIVVHRSTASTSPNNLIDTHISRPQPGPTESETLGLRPNQCFNKPSR